MSAMERLWTYRENYLFKTHALPEEYWVPHEDHVELMQHPDLIPAYVTLSDPDMVPELQVFGAPVKCSQCDADGLPYDAEAQDFAWTTPKTFTAKALASSTGGLFQMLPSGKWSKVGKVIKVVNTSPF